MTTIIPGEKAIGASQLMAQLNDVITDIEHNRVVYVVDRTGGELPFVLAPTVIGYLAYLSADTPGRRVPDMMAYAGYICYPTERQPQWEPRLQLGEVGELCDIAATADYTPLIGNAACTRLLSQYEDIKQQWFGGRRDSGGWTALARLSQFHDYPQSWELIKQLIDMGADVNERLLHGETLLMRAATSQCGVRNESLPSASRDTSLELLEYLIAKGADINAVDDHGNNALMRMLKQWQ